MAKKIKTVAGTSQGFEIIANREGLMRLAVDFLRLAMQTENNEQLLPTGGNHLHYFADDELEPGSEDFIVVYKPDL